jgi:hypothetical protein
MLRDDSIAASLLCLGNNTKWRYKKKIPMQCTFNMSYEVLRSGNQNLQTKEWEGVHNSAQGNPFSKDIDLQIQVLLRASGAPAAIELKKSSTTIAKSSQESCALCPAQFAVVLDRIGGSSDPCSPLFRESRPCYHSGNSSLAHWKLWQRSSPAWKSK